jgi:iron complex outermembrane receptor protein
MNRVDRPRRRARRLTAASRPGFILLFALGAGGTAGAQEETSGAGDAPLTSGETIVITAQKREQRLVDVPLAVTAIAGDEMDSAAAHNIESLPRLIPTLTLRRGTTTGNSALFLRGIGTTSFSLAAEPSVATVVDGVVHARSGQAFADLFDVERVEVLRGPQGTLFGKNASAGVINLTTRRPQDLLEAEFAASAFTDREYRMRGAISGPLAPGLQARLAAFHGQMAGHIENVYLDEKVNGYSRQGGRGVLEWQVLAPLRLTVIGDYGRGDDDCCAEVLAVRGERSGVAAAVAEALGPEAARGPAARTVNQNLRTANRDETGGLSAQADLEALGHTFTSISAYRRWDNREIRDGDFLAVGASHVGLFELHDRGDEEVAQLSHELRLMSPGGRRLEYQAGLFFFHVDADRTFTRSDITCTESTLTPDATGVAPCTPGASMIATPAATASFGSTLASQAAFGEGLWRLASRLRLGGGLRFTRDQLSFYHSRSNRSGLGGPGVQPGDFPRPELGIGPVFTGSTTEYGVAGRSVLQFDLIDVTHLFVSYARGYKGPAFNVFFNFTEESARPIDPETSHAFEAGLKGSLLEGRLYLGATAFLQRFDNFQANSFRDLNGTVITTLTNAGTVSTRGVEAEFTAHPLRGLEWSGSVAHLDAQIDEFHVPPGAPPSATDRAGEELPLSPDWKVALGGAYRLPRGALPWQVALASQLAWQSAQYSDFGENPDLEIGAHALWDASVTLSSADERLSLGLLVRNLLDEHFAALITPGGSPGLLRYQVPRDAHRFAGLTLTARI